MRQPGRKVPQPQDEATLADSIGAGAELLCASLSPLPLKGLQCSRSLCKKLPSP